MSVSHNLKDAIEQTLNTSIKSASTVHGGDINQAAKIETDSDVLFLKWNKNAPEGMFEAEAKGLALLATATDLKVPEVVAVGSSSNDTPPFLVLEWLESGRGNPVQLQEQLGEGLAQLHLSQKQTFGLDHDNYIGSLPQSNKEHHDWLAFFIEERIRPQMAMAKQNGRLSAELEANLNNLISKLPELLPQNLEKSSLLHGDLWSGNYMTLARGEPALIDPAVYYGHREIELAFTELFGGFSFPFYEAYKAVFPIDAGYQRRKHLYQLYPLMTHMNLFGGGYINRVSMLVQSYL